MQAHVVAIDQGTTSTRAIVFDSALQPLAVAQQEITQHYPAPGHVEHDAEEIWQSVVATVGAALEKAGLAAADIAAIGITNQRETTVIWDRATGKPVHRAIVWQDRRTADLCGRLKSEGHEGSISERTGLLIDPYFSGTKIAWMLDQVEGVRAAAEAGKLAFGTIDSFLLWRLTGGKTFATDATNASRTLLLDLKRARWDDDMLRLFRVPAKLLPEVRDSAGDFGTTGKSLFGAPIAIRGIAGDQQAAVIGQACVKPGMMKATYGTGCFALLHTGDQPIHSTNRLLTTIAYQLNGKRAYALEGAIFIAGAAVQWLRDAMGIIRAAPEADALAAKANPQERVILVPAFTGLGAPWWDAEARGAIFGLTRASGAAELARAVIESVGFQTADLLEAMRADWPAGAHGGTVLRVDGGMARSDIAMQFLADILDAPIDRPNATETTARGAAYLAGFAAGIYPDLKELEKLWQLERRFMPAIDATARAEALVHWRDAVRRTRSH
ncbi:MAG TPA: glycerol kinase GlpK [Xanthobacteraceae bacterium]|nr:glycerol kinase GlpK [Xanthobacteraceae bacterium]